jgi:hypothetical protein
MNQQNAKIKTTANYGSAMESGDHFKNGASQKSQKSRGNILMRSFAVISILLLSNCVTIAYSQNCESLLQRATDLVSQRKYCDAIGYYQQYSNCKANADVSTEIAMCERYCKLSGEESTPEPVVGNSPDYTSASTGRSSSSRSAQLSAAPKNVQGIKFGVTAGFNLSNFSGDVENTKLKAGFQVGVVADYALTKSFSITPELLFTQRGSKAEATEGGLTATYTETLNYLQLPINALYKFNIADDAKFLVFAGPYFGYGLSGTAKYKLSGGGESESESEDIKFGSDEDKYNAFDFGLNAGIGYQYNKFFIKAQYNLGLGNLFNDSDDSLKNTNIGISVGYLF